MNVAAVYDRRIFLNSAILSLSKDDGFQNNLWLDGNAREFRRLINYRRQGDVSKNGFIGQLKHRNFGPIFILFFASSATHFIVIKMS